MQQISGERQISNFIQTQQNKFYSFDNLPDDKGTVSLKKDQ